VLTIGWDTLAGSKHALDYLTSFDRTETTADPCSGVGCGGSPNLFPIPTNPFGPPTQVSGSFACFNCTIVSVGPYTAPNGSGGEQTIAITFTTTVANPVIAWGGHIADEIDWGQVSGAANINGSSYHMRLKDLDGKGGNQDRALTAAAVAAPPGISTPVSASSVTVGSSVTDTATLTGTSANGVPFGTVNFFECGPSSSPPDCSSGGSQVGVNADGTGTVTFTLFDNSTCSGTAVFSATSGGVSGSGTKTVTSADYTTAKAGTYYWIASYSGDSNNNPAVTSCGDTGETSTVSPGSAKVIKTVNGATPTGTQSFTFQLRQGASNMSDGTILEQVDANSANNWTINFTTQLAPDQHYQLCEWVYPGWNTSLGPNLFVPNSIIPPNLPNPNVINLTVCTDFVAQAGQTTTFTVDNTPPPGGRALTIGFWKNWASCASSNGKQKPLLDQTLAIATGMTANPPGGLVVSAQNPGGGWPNFAATYYLILKGSTSTPNVAPDCSKAVNLLNKTTIDGKTKKSSDPLFNMAAQLVGVQLNYFAGAGKNGTTTINIQSAVLLLGKYGFNGLPYSPKLTSADTATANCLATQLDNYNNDRSVSTCP
jgi:hypothetical protein